MFSKVAFCRMRSQSVAARGWRVYLAAAARTRATMKVAKILLLVTVCIALSECYSPYTEGDPNRKTFLMSPAGNGYGPQGSMPLLIAAAAEGDSASVERLLEAGADVEANGYGKVNGTPLCFAVSHNHIQNVKMLIQHGANINTKTCRQPYRGGFPTYLGDNFTPLMVAAYLGHLDIADQLLAAEAQADELTSRGFSASDIAAAQGHIGLQRRIKLGRSSGRKSGSAADKPASVDIPIER